jgi:UDP-glucose 4-epimerase
MQLLAACQKASRVTRLIVKSSAAVYGSSAQDPALFTEDMEPEPGARSGFAKDSLEVEGYVRGLRPAASRRRRDAAALRQLHRPASPDADDVVLRAAGAARRRSGFDARLQFIHEDDGLEALRRATVEDRPGVFNIAAPACSCSPRRRGGPGA